MAAGDVVGDHEEIVRALYPPLWSERLGRATTIAFTQKNASVSRTAVLPYDDIVAIFKKDRGTAEPVVATLTTIVGKVCEACKNNPAEGFQVSVIEDPVAGEPGFCDNPSHAEIRASKVSDPTQTVGLSKKVALEILRAAMLRKVEQTEQ